MDVNATYCSKNSFIKVTDFFSVMTNTVSKKPPIYKMLWVAGISEGGGGIRSSIEWSEPYYAYETTICIIYIFAPFFNFWCTVFISQYVKTMEEQFHFSIYGYGIQWFWYCNDINQFCLDILKRICFNDVTVVCQQLFFFTS